MTKLQDFLNSSVPDVTGGRAGKQGDLFGLELECEGKNVNWGGDDESILKSWAPHRDGSLRDHHGQACEWVFNGPCAYKPAVERVNKLFDYLEGRKAKFVCSNRTSTHVHFNMADKTAYQVLNVFILFTIFEEILDKFCGEDREGNLFCLSTRLAEEQLQWVNRAVFTDFSFRSIREDARYCSLNLASLNKFNTVEFRGMRGLDNREDIINWLSIVNELCTYACYTMKNPVDLVEAISVKTPSGFMKEVFSDKNYKLLTENVPPQLIAGSIYEGLRLVQMLVYRIGTEFEQVRLRGRDFWASFSEGKEPAPDMDPKELADNGFDAFEPRAPRNIRGRPRLDNPFAVDLEAVALDGFAQRVAADNRNQAVRAFMDGRPRVRPAGEDI